MTLRLFLYLNHKPINYFLPHTCVCAYSQSTRLASTEACTHAHGLTHTQRGHTARLSAPAHHRGLHQMFHLFFSLPLFSLSQHLRETTDGWRGGESRRGGVFFFLFFFSSFFESKLNLNSVLPYADLQRNLPYAQKFRQTLNETKY